MAQLSLIHNPLIFFNRSYGFILKVFDFVRIIYPLTLDPRTLLHNIMSKLVVLRLNQSNIFTLSKWTIKTLECKYEDLRGVDY